MGRDTVYAIIIVLILIVLGIITFHYYAFISTQNNAALSAGFGTGFALLPMKENFSCSKCANRFTGNDCTAEQANPGRMCKACLSKCKD
jgi:hypothetical protein